VPGTITAGERVLPPTEQRVVPIFEAICAAAGAPLEKEGIRVLDFGAGAGRHVAEFRAAGYEAWGVDQHFSSHSEGSVEPEFLRSTHPPEYRLPFDDQEFDFVYSTSVMEHVTDPGRALEEIARVLRPGGVSAHVFPSRWRPIEPHIYTPFGGRVQNYWALRLWAALGIRNEYQAGLSPTETALHNAQYCKTGLSYPTAHEWELLARPLFARVGWGEASFIRASRPVSKVSRVFEPLLQAPGAESLYRAIHTRVLVLHA
jgi:SAM-dependent methyltransferase